MKKNFFKSKAFRITLISLLSVGILTGGGIYLARRNRTSKAVDVYPVNSISQQNWEQFGTYGSVMPGSSDTYRKSSAVVKEVYVQLGDEVEEGTPLFAYDTTSVEIAKNKAYTAWQLALLDVEDAKKQLEIYKTYTPYEPIEPIFVPTELYVDSFDQINKEDSGNGTAADKAYVFDITAQTSISLEFLFNLAPDPLPIESDSSSLSDTSSVQSEQMEITTSSNEEVVSDTTSSSSISEISETSETESVIESSIEEETHELLREYPPEGTYVQFNIWQHNDNADSKKICTWIINWNKKTSDAVKNYVNRFPNASGASMKMDILLREMGITIDYENKKAIIPEKLPENLASFSTLIKGDDVIIIDPIEIPESKSYSQEEINEMIAEQSRKITTLDIAARQAELDYKKANAAAVDGVVKSTCPGIISILNDYDTLEANGVFMTVQSNAGLIIQGTIDELDLDVISPGMSVNVMDMRTGMGYEAVVKEISSVPQRYGDMMQSVNPNSSFYSFKAELVDTTAEIEVYSYVQMMFDSSSDNDAFYIPVQFVRKENGSNYVMMMDENGLLKKQFIKTGATLYGYLVEVKGGLTEDDYIAFPYGKTVNEGAKCNTDADMSALYGY